MQESENNLRHWEVQLANRREEVEHQSLELEQDMHLDKEIIQLERIMSNYFFCSYLKFDFFPIQIARGREIE